MRAKPKYATAAAPLHILCDSQAACSTSGRDVLQPGGRLTWSLHQIHGQSPFAAVTFPQHTKVPPALLLHCIEQSQEAIQRQSQQPGRQGLNLAAWLSKLPIAALSLPWFLPEDKRVDVLKVGDVVAEGRYKIQSKVVDSRLSSIWAATDTRDDSVVIIKVPREGAPQSFHDGVRELDLTRRAQGSYPPKGNAADSAAGGTSEAHGGVVRLLGHFVHQSPVGRHACLVLEPLGDNLSSVMSRFFGGLGLGLPLPVVKVFTRQALQTLDSLHRERGIIHMSVHPDNLVLERPFESLLLADVLTVFKYRAGNFFRQLFRQQEVPPPLIEISPGAFCETDLQSASLNLIDFSNARTLAEADASILSATGIIRFNPLGYRPPEELLALSNTPGFDIWQLGCTVWWMVTGVDLFHPNDGEDFDRDEHHLCEMMSVLDRYMPQEMIQSSPVRGRFFMKSGRLQMESKHRLMHEDLEDLLVEHHGLERQEAAKLMQFLRPLLRYDASRRPSAAELLRHPWLWEDVDAVSAGESEGEALAREGAQPAVEGLQVAPQEPTGTQGGARD